tara:strand:- start:118 stop:588 length:471 start_codon:yes stop_codon:yes gene_type:complete
MEIEKLLELFNIKDYKITPRGVNIYENVQISEKIRIKKIPFNINICFGTFSVIRNDLTTLENCPRKIYGDFHCGWNKLTSLENGPSYVDGNYYCYENLLKSNFSNTIVTKRFNTSLKEDELEFINNSYVVSNYRLWQEMIKRKRILNKIKNNKDYV